MAVDLLDDDVKFVAELMERLRGRSPRDRLAPLERAVAAVEDRRHDPHLYLALVGEFSSGKSSFANALLGERLFETTPVPNTAAVTMIRHGAQAELRVRFRGDRRLLLFPSKALTQRFARFGQTPGSLVEAVRCLVNDEAVAPAVERVEIAHPSPLLGDEIVVLDTPGINSTVQAHAAAALEAIAADADRFVVLISGTSPISLRLMTTLGDRLKPYLHRMTFVVTRLHHVEPDERAAVLATVRDRLESELRVEDPVVVGAALGPALRAQRRGGSGEPEEAEWLASFEALRADLVARLARERAVTIAERVVALLQDALELLDDCLRSESESLAERAAALKASAPADLASFSRAQRVQAGTAVGTTTSAARRRLATEFDLAETAALAAVRKAIDGAGTQAELRAVLDSTPAMVGVELECATRATRTAMDAVSRTVRDEQRRLDGAFQAQYEGIERLAGTRFAPPTGALPPTPAVTRVSTDAQALRRSLDRKRTWTMAGSAGVGAVVGTALIPIPLLGTLVGAGLGSLFGSTPDGTALAARKAAYWQELEPDVRTVFGDLRSNNLNALDQHAAAASGHLVGRVARYQDRYDEAIRTLTADNNRARTALRAELRRARADAAEVEQRMNALRRRAAHLARADPHRGVTFAAR